MTADRTEDLSDEAVEQVAEVLHQRRYGPASGASTRDMCAWKYATDWQRGHYLAEARAALAIAAPSIRSREADRIANEIEDQITGQPEHTHYDSAYAHSALIARAPRGKEQDGDGD